MPPLILMSATVPLLLDKQGNPRKACVGSFHISSKKFIPAGVDYFIIQPKVAQMFFQWQYPSNLNSMKFSSVASIFTSQAWRSTLYPQKGCQPIQQVVSTHSIWLSQALDASKLLKKVWRVFFHKESSVTWLQT